MNKKVKYTIVVACTCLATAFMGKTTLATTGTLINETTRLREKASTNSEIVELLSEDEKVEVVTEEGEWYKVKYTSNDKTYVGYVRKDMVKVDSKEEKNNSSENTDKTKTEESKKENTDTKKKKDNDIAKEKKEEEKDNSSEKDNNQDEKQANIIENLQTNIKNDLEIKALPLISSSNTGSIKSNTDIKVLEILGNWCYVESDSQSGWTMKSKLKVVDNQNNKVENNKQETEKEENENKKDDTEIKKEEPKKQETASVELYVSAETVNVREKTDTTSRILKQLSKGDKVTAIEVIDDTWTKVNASGTVGYVASAYLVKTKAGVTSRGSDEVRKAEPKKEETTPKKDDENNKSNTTNQKNKTNTDSKSKSSKNNTEKPKTTNSKKEETPKKEDTSNDKNPSSSKVTGADIVAYAKKFLGCKYVLGGTTPAAFDCSGFTQYVYKHFGYKISRTSSAQRSNGKHVKKSELQPGDILCFTGHVGIYIGGNQFIHASNPKGGVKITSLSNSYYVKHYITARRIL